MDSPHHIRRLTPETFDWMSEMQREAAIVHEAETWTEFLAGYLAERAGDSRDEETYEWLAAIRRAERRPE